MIFEMSETLKQRRLKATLLGPPVGGPSGSNTDRTGAPGSRRVTGTGTSSTSGSAGGGEEPGPACGEEELPGFARFITQQVKLLGVIGRGTFASVYRATWRGRVVAVKVLHLPAHGVLTAGQSQPPAGRFGEAAGSLSLQSHERMAVMEAVVSTTMSHPNIVQVYTYELQPLIMKGPVSVNVSAAAGGEEGQPLQAQVAALQEAAQEEGDGELCGWELRLLMEYCEEVRGGELGY
jgi:hypothetical protein